MPFKVRSFVNYPGVINDPGMRSQIRHVSFVHWQKLTAFAKRFYYAQFGVKLRDPRQNFA